MALVVDAVANGGVMMQPYLVAKATSPDSTIVYEQSSRPWRTAITAQTAATLTTMMVGVVNEGSGSAARIPQISVAAKTGTAQVSTGANPHAWFVAFAPADQPTVEVVVLIENGGEGATVAGPIAAQLLQQALKLND
jgi:peptidoglycan glycosyltransferase